MASPNKAFGADVPFNAERHAGSVGSFGVTKDLSISRGFCNVMFVCMVVCIVRLHCMLHCMIALYDCIV